MPDVLTHLIVGTSIALLVRRDDNRIEQMLVILGAVVVDIERPISWLLTHFKLEWIGLSSALHSIIGVLILSYFAAVCFVIEDVSLKSRFKLILIGCTVHLMLDLIMYPWIEMGLYLLYPLKVTFSFNLLWPDYPWYPLLGASVLLVVLCLNYILKVLR